MNDAEVGLGIPSFIVHDRYCVFSKLKVCGNLAWSKSANIVFITAFAHLVYLHQILVVPAVFQSPEC